MNRLTYYYHDEEDVQGEQAEHDELLVVVCFRVVGGQSDSRNICEKKSDKYELLI